MSDSRTITMQIAMILIALMLVPAPAPAETQSIPIRSGDGAGVEDANVRIADAVAGGMAAGQSALLWPAATRILDHDVESSGLVTDPSARWIRAVGEGRVLYATPITVNENDAVEADFEGLFATADGGNVDLYLNDTFVSSGVASLDATAVAYHHQSDVGSLLVHGVNWLYIDAPADGVVFSARLELWPRPDENTAPLAPADADECPFPPGDLDRDCDVDLSDWVRFLACFEGTGVNVAGSCVAADLDCDADADLADALILQAAFTGPR